MIDQSDYAAIVRTVRQAVEEGLRQALDDVRAQQATHTRYLSLSDAARIYGIGRRRLRGHIRAGELPAYAPGGGKLLIAADDLDRFIRTHAAAAGDVDVETIADEVIEEMTK